MLNRPSNKVLAALASLEGHTDFEVIRVWLAESLQNLDAVSRETSDSTLCRWRQGAAQAVAQVLDYSAKSRSILQKSR